MKYLILMLLAPMSAFAIHIEEPTHYDNGDVLNSGDIRHYVICIALTPEDVCDSELIVVGSTLALSELPENTHHIKGRTVITNGMTGKYGPRFSEAFRYPGWPTFTINIENLTINIR